MNSLSAHLLKSLPSDLGPQADVLLVEPNGDKYTVRCLCKPDGTTDVGEAGNARNLSYLAAKYGSQNVVSLLRRATLSTT